MYRRIRPVSESLLYDVPINSSSNARRDEALQMFYQYFMIFLPTVFPGKKHRHGLPIPIPIELGRMNSRCKHACFSMRAQLAGPLRFFFFFYVKASKLAGAAGWDSCPACGLRGWPKVLGVFGSTPLHAPKAKNAAYMRCPTWSSAAPFSIRTAPSSTENDR